MQKFHWFRLKCKKMTNTLLRCSFRPKIFWFPLRAMSGKCICSTYKKPMYVLEHRKNKITTRQTRVHAVRIKESINSNSCNNITYVSSFNILWCMSGGIEFPLSTENANWAKILEKNLEKTHFFLFIRETLLEQRGSNLVWRTLSTKTFKMRA